MYMYTICTYLCKHEYMHIYIMYVYAYISKRVNINPVKLYQVTTGEKLNYIFR